MKSYSLFTWFSEVLFSVLIFVPFLDLGANRMMDFQPYSARPRFPSVHNNFHHSGHDISPNLTHHHIPHSGSLPQTQVGHDAACCKE